MTRRTAADTTITNAILSTTNSSKLSADCNKSKSKISGSERGSKMKTMTNSKMTDTVDIGGSSDGIQGGNTAAAAANGMHGECLQYVTM
jgi:hypothetical protein